MIFARIFGQTARFGGLFCFGTGEPLQYSFVKDSMRSSRNEVKPRKHTSFWQFRKDVRRTVYRYWYIAIIVVILLASMAN